MSSSNPDRVKKAIERIQAAYPSSKANISGHACDLGKEDTLEDNVQALLEKTGKLDHIIHTAGDSLSQTPLESASLQQIKQAGMVRFFAPLIIAKYAKKYLNPGRESSYTITTGATAEKPYPGWDIVTSYAAGLPAMGKSLALSFKPIRVNVVSPGAVLTELWDAMGEEKKNEIMEHHNKILPTGKVADPEDVAEAYLYLLKDYNVTGAMISTNGGGLLI